MENKSEIIQENGPLMGKLVHLAIPVRWSPAAQRGRGTLEMACTYDVHPRGARLLGSREVSVGDLILVERGRHKAMCEVVWAASRDSQLRGQFCVQCVEEGRTPWDEELRQLEEQYSPMVAKGKQGARATKSDRRGDENRRRTPRYRVEGKADLIEGSHRVEGEVRQLSEFGARIAGTESLQAGSDFRLHLNVFDVSVALKAQVMYKSSNSVVGVQFQEIRRGDRPLLNYVLSELSKRKVGDFPEVEVDSDSLAHDSLAHDSLAHDSLAHAAR